MRRVGEIMKGLGFREDAPESVQKAFIKNLIRAAYGAEVEDLQEYRQNQRQATSQETIKTKQEKKISPGPNEETQLSFQFMRKNG